MQPKQVVTGQQTHLADYRHGEAEWRLRGLKHKSKEAFYMHSILSGFTLEILFRQLSASGASHFGEFIFLPCNIKGLGQLLLQKRLSCRVLLHRAGALDRHSGFPQETSTKQPALAKSVPAASLLNPFAPLMHLTPLYFTPLQTETSLRLPPHIDLVNLSGAILRSSEVAGKAFAVPNIPVQLQAHVRGFLPSRERRRRHRG